MPAVPSLDRLDSRLLLRAYAAVVIPIGFYVTLWGNGQIEGAHGELNGLPWGIDSLVRVAGTCVVLAGFCAAAFAEITNPLERRRCLGWFTAGHAMVLVIMELQRIAIWPAGLADWAVRGVLLATAVLAWGYVFAAGDPPPGESRTLFVSDRSAVARLRSEYEDHIRAIAAQEERHRLARDLHDAVKQQIFAIQTSAATAEMRFESDREGARDAIATVRENAREASAEMEAMLDQLHASPLENAGLVESIQKQCDALKYRTGAEVTFTVGDLPANASVSPAERLAILRVVQEALANVARHARARHVRVSLGPTRNGLSLDVSDDGSGFDTDAVENGMGLRNMRERAAEVNARLTVDGRLGHGARITFTLSGPSADRTNYRTLAIWSAVGTAAAVASWSFTDRSGDGFIWFVAIGGCLNLLRYSIAWIRSRPHARAFA